MWKISRDLFLICLVVFSFVGCKPNHRVIYEKFEVSSLGAPNDEMSCRISLDGSAQRAGVDKSTGMSLSYVKSPYTLFVSFRFPKDQTGFIELKNVSFFANDTLIGRVDVNRKEKFDNKTEFRKGGVSQVREDEESRASFLVRQIEILHSKLKVVVTGLISTEDGEVLKIWEFDLTPFTEEEIRNDLRDAIMSV